MAATYRRTQDWIWRILGLALGSTVGVALLAVLYAGRLEGRVRSQREKETQNARDLQRLSAKLFAAQEDERRCIARELHDEVGQVLTLLKVELAMAQRNVASNGGSAHALDEARKVADGALQTVRDLSRLLHPALLDDHQACERTHVPRVAAPAARGHAPDRGR
jgi:signal transduction histidine kinase